MIELELMDEQQTAALGAAASAAMRRAGADRGVVIYLQGPLGAGKTSFCRGLLRAHGVTGQIRSPTYTVMEAYPDLPATSVLHLDLYRLADPFELEQLGLEDFPPPAWSWLVEWPDRGAGLLPAADLQLQLTYAAAGRRAKLLAQSALGEYFIKGLQGFIPDHIK